MDDNIYAKILFANNKYTKTVIKCEKCNSDQVNVMEQQVRSSDEPVALFITCLKCSYVSVDMGD